MGLDMYLSAKQFIRGHMNHSADEEKTQFEIIRKAMGIPSQLVDRRGACCHFDFCVCYWRKANAIHAWFLRNVQERKDECEAHHVTVEKLRELLLSCKQVLADPTKAESLLPTQPGFFFGDTAYGENYKIDLRHTVEKLELILTATELKDWDFLYRSSW